MILLAYLAVAVIATASPPTSAIDQIPELADDLEKRGNFEGAALLLKDAARNAIQSRRAEFHMRAARLLARHQRWEEALAEGHAGIAAAPTDGWGYIEVAKILEQTGRRAAAIELAQEAASHDARVRFAAQDFIFELQASNPKASPLPSAAEAQNPNSPFRALLAALLAIPFVGAGYYLWRRRRTHQLKRIVPVFEPLEDGVTETAPLGYGRPLASGEFIGPYRVDKVVATSLHSTLYRAEDLRLGRQVAIKQANSVGMQNEAALVRFQKEVQSLIALSTYHDGVIKVYDYLPPGTLVTEWVEGENLDELVGELPIDRVIQIGIDLCDILGFAHSMSIIHRDIKPSNVMVSKQTGRVKLLDFGIAKNAGLGISQVTTDSDVPIGTFTYMAPEQFASPNQAAEAADLYSLGLTIYRLITGTLPAMPWLGPRTFTLVPPDAFQPIDEFAPAIQSFLENLEDLLPDLDWVEDLDRVVAKSYREQAKDRYQRAADFRLELERLRDLVFASVRA